MRRKIKTRYSISYKVQAFNIEDNIWQAVGWWLGEIALTELTITAVLHQRKEVFYMKPEHFNKIPKELLKNSALLL